MKSDDGVDLKIPLGIQKLEKIKILLYEVEGKAVWTGVQFSPPPPEALFRVTSMQSASCRGLEFPTSEQLGASDGGDMVSTGR